MATTESRINFYLDKMKEARDGYRKLLIWLKQGSETENRKMIESISAKRYRLNGAIDALSVMVKTASPTALSRPLKNVADNAIEGFNEYLSEVNKLTNGENPLCLFNGEPIPPVPPIPQVKPDIPFELYDIQEMLDILQTLISWDKATNPARKDSALSGIIRRAQSICTRMMAPPSSSESAGERKEMKESPEPERQQDYSVGLTEIIRREHDKSPQNYEERQREAAEIVMSVGLTESDIEEIKHMEPLEELLNDIRNELGLKPGESVIEKIRKITGKKA